MSYDQPINLKDIPLAWVDLEMTGLNPDTDRILEMAIIVTDSELNIIEEGPVLAIHQTEECLSKMDEWNTTHHNESGLVERVRASQLNEMQAEETILAFLKTHFKARQSPLCGNSICQDRRFLYRYMPKLEAYFHYRNLDVSTIKELARRWAPEVYAGVKKSERHLALDDIRESINELRHYKAHLFKL